MAAILVFVVVALRNGSVGLAQGKAGEAPAITELQRLQLVTLSQRLEIAQLKAQAAQRDFDQARQELSGLVGMLEAQAPGFAFDLASLTFRPKPEAK